MRKALFVLFILSLALAIAACGTPAATPSSDPIVSTAPRDPYSASETAIVTFADPVLESLIRATIGKPSGDITSGDVKAVTRLDLSGEWQGYRIAEGIAPAPIQDIGGLQAFSGLEYLDLSGHAISDITPLAGLTKLNTLILAGNPIADLTPLSALTNLKLLNISFCAAPDYRPLEGLTSLEDLILKYSSITDVSPLAGLKNLKFLFLEGSLVGDYFPLSDIYPNLLEKDFIIATTLVELGFYMDDNGKQAILDGDEASVRLNHREWGNPPEDWTGNCLRVVFGQNDYKIDIGYYPEHDAYVVMAFQNDLVLNYVYNISDDSQYFSPEDRVGLEETVRAVFAGTEMDPDDVLLTPIRVYQDLLAKTAGLSVEALYEMPFDENDKSLPTAFTRLGFTFLDYKGTYFYEETDPRESYLYIHRPDWDTDVAADQRLDWSMEFYDSDVNGYKLYMLYYAESGLYRFTLEKDGVEAGLEITPATGERGGEYPDLDTAHQMFGDAFGIEGKELYDAPVTLFDQFLRDRFGMGVDELYAMEE